MAVNASKGNHKNLVVILSVGVAVIATTMLYLQSNFEMPVDIHTKGLPNSHSDEAKSGHATLAGKSLADDGSFQDRTLGYSQDDQKAFKQEYNFTNDFFLPSVPLWSLALAELQGKADVQYLEVGAYQGMSVCWMLENILTGSGAHVTAIDPFLAFDGNANSKETYYHNIQMSGKQDQVETIEGFSQVELRKLALSHYDIVYIDGSHRGPDVLEDAILSIRLLKPGGLLIFDDYSWNMQFDDIDRPDGAINTFYHFYSDQLDVVHKGYQVIFRKTLIDR